MPSVNEETQMRLRRLELKDAPLMLEWMHDEEVTRNLRANFKNKTLEDCEAFIISSWNCSSDLHLAIADINDTYQGTVSLKKIDSAASSAEFAITIRKGAMGNGLAYAGMKDILRIGKDELNLNAIYWCVDSGNHRAVRFYDKNGFIRTTTIPETIKTRYTGCNSLLWYCW